MEEQEVYIYRGHDVPIFKISRMYGRTEYIAQYGLERSDPTEDLNQLREWVRYFFDMEIWK